MNIDPSNPEATQEPVLRAVPDLLAGQQPPPPPQQERSRRKRDALLSAALSLFARHGYEETSIEQIAHAANVAVGGFYQHFTSKRQMLLVLMDGLLQEIGAFSSQASSVNVSDPQTIIALLVRRGLQIDWAYAGAYRAWREAALQDHELRTLNLQIEAWFAQQLALLLGSLQQFPHVRLDVDVPLLAWELTLLFFRLAENPIEEEATIEKVITSLTHLIYHGIFQDNGIAL